MTDDLARRIAAIEAREEIRDLVIRYGPAEIPDKLDTWQQFFAGAEA